MVLGTRLELFQVRVFLVCAEVMPGCLATLFVTFLNLNCSPGLSQSEKCTCGPNSSNWTLLDSFAFFSPSVTIRNVGIDCIVVCIVCLLIPVEQNALFC